MIKIGTLDPLSLLERKDKWFLGGGKGAIYAPPFPRWLESPGFWDESYFADIKLTRLFTVLFCESSGKPVRLRGELVSWRPDRMIIEHRSASHTVLETRVVTEHHEWVSVFELISGDSLSAFVWSLPEMNEPGYGAPWQSLTDCRIEEESITYDFATRWPSEIEPDRTGVEDERIANLAASSMLPALDLSITLSANQPRVSHTVNLAQRHDDSPIWQTSLLLQKLRDGRLPGDFKLKVGPPPMEGLVHILQQYELGYAEPLVVTCQVGIKGRDSVQPIPATENVVAENEESWQTYFASVPQFSSSDPFLTNAYWYRWYGLRLNTVDIPELPVSRSIGFQATEAQGQDGPGTHRLEADVTYSPFVTEGVGFFRNFVTYSAQAHLREVAWMHSPRLALGILENLGKCQREDGSFPGHNYSCRPARDFYHADFASGIGWLRSIHRPKLDMDIVSAMQDYGEYMVEHRMVEPPEKNLVHAYCIFDQNETGQEYMSRYLFASDDADHWSTFRIAGVDATSYMVNLAFELADLVPEHLASSDWVEVGIGASEGLSRGHWDAESLFYADFEPRTGRKSPARPAAGLYALGYGTGVSLADQAQMAHRWLLNPDEFWLPKGLPATALSDTTFNQDAEWKGKRLNCPWNGRSWPMVNSHLVDALANVARSLGSMQSAGNLDPENQVQNAENAGSKEPEKGAGLVDFRVKAGEALLKVVTLMFHDGDANRPNSYEHYDPITGTPSLYRGYDDYMHSWIVDLIMRHAVGVKRGEDEIDPFPLGIDWIECTDIPHPRGRMHVRIERDKVVRCEVIDKPSSRESKIEESKT